MDVSLSQGFSQQPGTSCSVPVPFSFVFRTENLQFLLHLTYVLAFEGFNPSQELLLCNIAGKGIDPPGKEDIPNPCLLLHPFDLPGYLVEGEAYRPDTGETSPSLFV